jgi:hypothetical protein
MILIGLELTNVDSVPSVTNYKINNAFHPIGPARNQMYG